MIAKIKNKMYALFFWQSRFGEFLNKMYDLNIFYRYSFAKISNSTAQMNLAYYLTKQYHIIEKGLALPEPRVAFGRQVIENLIDKTQLYIETYGKSDLVYAIASCLNEYLEFNKQKGEIMEDMYFVKINTFVLDIGEKNKSGGTITISKQVVLSAIDFNFDTFVKTRSSVRDFSNENVPIDDIITAINLAKYTPSVCNRQGWNAHVYTDKEKIKKLLLLQNGNRGFTDQVNKLILITGDVRAFTKMESNQLYTDGGLFAMSVLYALHAQGLGAIALNTCFPYILEKKVIKIASIPEYQRLIMMIGVGNIKENYKVARSERKSTDLICKVHN